MEHPIPGWEGYFLTDDYQVISYRRSRKVLKPVINKPNPSGNRTEVMFSMRKDGKTLHPRLHRLILAVKLGRWPEWWEHARHRDGDHTNNTWDNIVCGCVLLNLIDDLELGTRLTSADNIDVAIERLQQLKVTLAT